MTLELALRGSNPLQNPDYFDVNRRRHPLRAAKPDCYAWPLLIRSQRAGGAICRYEQVF